jgi:SAM-dependent methyltransferase
MDISKEITFFDDFEAAHGEYDVLGERAYRRLLRVFGDVIQPIKGERCYDLGCGTGAFTRRLSAFGLELTGVDISPRSIQAASLKSSAERYLVGDIRATDLCDGAADIVVYSGVLHHCNERPVRLAVLREGLRILRPGGRLFAFDPSAHSPSMWLYRNPASPLYSSKGKTENEVLLTRHDVRAELEEAGFSLVTVRGVSGISYRYVEDGWARLILPLYNFYEEVLRFSPLENAFGTFLVSFAVKPNAT